MPTYGPRTGTPYDIGNTIRPASDWNNFVKYADFGLARVLVELLTPNGIVTAEINQLQIDELTGRIAVPSDAIVGVINGQFIYMDDTREHDGTASGGSTTTAVDLALSEADDFWLGAYIIFTSGDNAGAVREISGFSQTHQRLAWADALPSTVNVGDEFVVTFYYVQDLTDDDENYVYGRATSRTGRDQTVEWVANTTGTPAAGDIFVATVTLDALGDVTSSDNSPEDADRVLYPGIGAHDVLVLEGSVENVPPAGEVVLTRSHDYLLYRGGLRFVLTEDFSMVVNEAWKPDEVQFTITNDGSYDETCAYTCYVEGRKRRYL